jgi:hypothetical protein
MGIESRRWPNDGPMDQSEKLIFIYAGAHGALQVLDDAAIEGNTDTLDKGQADGNSRQSQPDSVF